MWCPVQGSDPFFWVVPWFRWSRVELSSPQCVAPCAVEGRFYYHLPLFCPYLSQLEPSHHTSLCRLSLGSGLCVCVCVSERGKGRQRQAILGEHPSNGYGTVSLPDVLLTSDSSSVCLTTEARVCFPAGPHCPLLPLPANSRYRRSSEEVKNPISYPLLLPKTSSSSSFMSHQASSSVAMVSGLHPNEMNCSRIFNLFCLYGNVEKVRFPS